SLRCNRDAKELFVPSGPAFIFNAVYYAVFILTCVRSFLSGSLVWANTDFFIFLGAGVPQVKLIRDITADRHAFGVEQSNAVWAGRVEPVVRLTEHLRHEQFHSPCSPNRKLVRITRTDWTCGHCTGGCIEHAMKIRAVVHCHERGH